MQKQDFRTALVEFIRREARPQDKFSHQERLYRLAVRLAEDHAFDDEVLFAAAWIHDLGVFVGHRPDDPQKLANWDNVAYVLRVGPEILQRLGLPASKIPAVMEVVRTHLPDVVPQSFEGVLLRDADILEQLGAVGILRVVSKVGRDTRFHLFEDALRVLERNLQELPGRLMLECSRKEAAKRVEVMRAFLVAATGEGVGEKD